MPPFAGKNSPVNLSQIAHDLDAKLLEFTLMAKAREQLADESDQAEEAEKFAWRQGERQRIERKVRVYSISYVNTFLLEHKPDPPAGPFYCYNTPRNTILETASKERPVHMSSYIGTCAMGIVCTFPNYSICAV